MPDRLDLTQSAAIDEALGCGGVTRVTQVLRDHQGRARAVGGPDHVPAFLYRVRHGFLDQHVFAGLCGGDGLRRMQIVPGADIDGIDVGPAQHVVEVQVDVIDAGPLGVVPCRGFDHVAHGRQAHPVRMLQVRGHVPVGNASGADQTHLEWSGHDPSVSLLASAGSRDGDVLARERPLPKAV